MPIILIVDDEEDQEQLILQRFGHKEFLSEYQFLYARNGLEAIEAMRKYPNIEIALVDINMPEMDGLTFLKKAKQYDPYLQVIIITAYGDMSNIRLAMNRGAFDFLPKPLEMMDLEVTIQKTIDHVIQLKEKIKIAEENMCLRQRAIELEMKAFRAQMNPHFIFNSLNSINNFILRNEIEQASDYLIKFSKLIRLILENSIRAQVSLERELDALALYIELEALRFEHSFEHEIRYSKDLDTLSIKVPPLLLQPFVENAIHHGLLPKKGPGHLFIDIRESDNYLLFRIKDNGIGREKAAKLRSLDKRKHEPLGLSVTTERINALTKGNTGTPSKMEIHDLVDESGNAVGTEVRINLELIT